MKKKVRLGRIIASILALILVFTSVPVSALAETEPGQEFFDEETSETEEISEETEDSEEASEEEISEEVSDNEEESDAEEATDESSEDEVLDEELESEEIEIEEINRDTATGEDAWIYSDTFPDANFRHFISVTYDKNHNGRLEYDTEIKPIKTMILSGKNIANLEGISVFSELTSITCNNNQIAFLNLDNNDKLTTLTCNNNVFEAYTNYNGNIGIAQFGYGFDESRTVWPDGIEIEDKELVIPTGKDTITYDYKCDGEKAKFQRKFSLKITSYPKEDYIKIDENIFPGEKFRSYVLNNIDLDRDGYLAPPEIDKVKRLDLSGIYDDFSGIERFDKLEVLYVRYNYELKELDLSECIALKEVYCSYNQAMETVKFGKNPNLIAIGCENCMIESLDLKELPNLETLVCDYNQLSELDVSRNTKLKNLSCAGNYLSNLDVSKNINLTILNISNNNMTGIDVSNCPKIKTVSNYWSGVYTSCDALGKFDLSKLGENGFDFKPNKASNWRLQNGSNAGNLSVSDGYLNIPMDSFYYDSYNECVMPVTVLYTYDCGRNKKVEFRLYIEPGEVEINEKTFPDEVFREYIKDNFASDGDTLKADEYCRVTEIDVEGGYKGKKIKDLAGIEYFSQLASLKCGDNEIESIDLRRNKRLFVLSCEKNLLRSLDISNNTGLYELNCGENKELSSLNVSGNPELMFLYVEDCPNLTALDVSKNSHLRTLECQNCGLKSLNLGKTGDLNYVNCSNNQLTALVMNNNITRLDCSNNQITSLDLRNNTYLSELNCENNQLSQLNVGNNTNLSKLNCNNQKALTTLDVSKNANLSTLECKDNQIQSLDVSNSRNLNSLDCSNNKLTNLKLDKNPNLTMLNCKDNKLTNLDVSKNTRLLGLDCSNNELSCLDVRNTFVQSLICDGNGTTITVRKDGEVYKYDLSMISGFDCEKASDWKGGSIEDKVLTIDAGVTQVTYSYTCKDSVKKTFTFNIVMPEKENEVKITLVANGGKISGLETKEIKVTVGKAYSGLVNPVRTGYNFDGWYTMAEGGNRITTADIVENVYIEKLYAHWTELGVELKVELKNQSEEFIYDGTAKKPEVVVKVGDTTLVEGTDYTIKYTNNTAANEVVDGKWTNDKKKPTITVTGKGNYSGSDSVNFQIKHLDLEWAYNSGLITIDPILLNYNKKVQKAKPVVKLNGKALKAGTDYTVEYPYSYSYSYMYSGNWSIYIVANPRGNFTGGIYSFYETITYSTLMSKLKYTIGDAAVQDEDEMGVTAYVPSKLIVKDGTRKASYDVLEGEFITEDTEPWNRFYADDCNAEYLYYISNNTNGAGTATITFIGNPRYGYQGEVKKTFKINPIKLSANDMTISVSTIEYGDEVPDVEMAHNGETLVEDVDFTLKMSEYKKGNVKFTATGIGKYSGTITKTYKITERVITDEADLDSFDYLDRVSYSKDGVNLNSSTVLIAPSEVKDNDKEILVLGKDYTISYTNNKAVNRKTGERDDNGNDIWEVPGKIPTMKITFKGNYKGSITKEFEILPKNMGDADITMTAKDIAWTNVKGKYTTTVALTDANGKKMAVNRDYTLEYYLGEVEEGLSQEELKTRLAGLEKIEDSKYILKDQDKVITVVARGKGYYNAETMAYKSYDVKTALISSAKISLASGVKKFYTGEQVTLSEDELVVKVGNKKLVRDVDYEIQEYKNNEKVGTATVTIRGKGDYGDSKTFNYTINKRNVKVNALDKNL